MATDEHHELRIRLLEGRVETLGTTLREAIDLTRQLNKVEKESAMYEPEGLVRAHDEIECQVPEPQSRP